ncbi:MAG: oligosaccharide flippase family protein [Bacteroidia bacterium]
MGVLKKLASQTLIYGGATILARALNIVLTPLYTNIFETGVYGVYVNLYAYVAFLNVLLTFGMETTFFRFVEDNKDPRRVYGQTFVWVSSLALVFALLAGSLHQTLADWMGYGDHPEFVLLFVAIILLDTLAALPLARLRQQERVRWFSGTLIMNVLVTLLANIVFVLILGKGIEYVFVANIIASAVRLAMSLWKNLPTHLRPDPALLRELIAYGGFIMLAGFAGIMNETLDRVMLPLRWTDGDLFDGLRMTGEQLNGIYGANYRVAMLIALAIQAFRYATEPFFFREAKKEDSPETFAKIFHYFLISALLGFLFIASFAWEIITFDFWGLFGPERTFVGRAYWSGVGIIPVLLLAYVLSAAYSNLSIWFKITKQTRFAILFTGTGALITILVNYLGIPHYAYHAGAWATLICYTAMCVLVYLVGQRYYPVPYRIGRISLYLLLMLAAYAANRQIGPAEGFALAWLTKLAVCATAVGVVFLAERYAPVFGSAAQTES